MEKKDELLVDKYEQAQKDFFSLIKVHKHIRIQQITGSGVCYFLLRLVNRFFEKTKKRSLIITNRLEIKASIEQMQLERFCDKDASHFPFDIHLVRNVKKDINISDFGMVIAFQLNPSSHQALLNEFEIDTRTRGIVFVEDFPDFSIQSSDGPFLNFLRIIPVIPQEVEQHYIETLKRFFQSDEGNSWEKLCSNSKTFLVTAEVIFSQLLFYGDNIDYSPVILLWTKTLENELKIRFYDNLKRYLKEKSDTSCEAFCQILINQKNKKERYFSLDLCQREIKFLVKNWINLPSLESYFGSFINLQNESIPSFLSTVNRDVGTVKKNFRDQAAHTAAFSLTSAIQCYDELLRIKRIIVKFMNTIK